MSGVAGCHGKEELMTPQERQLVTELFDRLATLENTPRDSDAERAVLEGLRRAPNATYALVQTALVQDEALKRADARIRELEARPGEDSAPRPGGFLDNMREALLGRAEPPGGSVPSVRPQVQSQGAAPAPSMPGQGGGPSGGGSSFLGTAAAGAAGVIGGSLLLNSIRSMMGPSHGVGAADPAFAAVPASPWDHSAGGDLARQGGVDEIGHNPHTGGDPGPSDNSADDTADEQADQESRDFADDSGDDSGDYDGGDSDSSDV
jgi:uncharacterized protein